MALPAKGISLPGARLCTFLLSFRLPVSHPSCRVPHLHPYLSSEKRQSELARHEQMVVQRAEQQPWVDQVCTST